MDSSLSADSGKRAELIAHDLGIAMHLAECCLANHRRKPRLALTQELLPGDREFGVGRLERRVSRPACPSVPRCLEQVRYVLRIVDEDLRGGLLQSEVL